MSGQAERDDDPVVEDAAGDQEPAGGDAASAQVEGTGVADSDLEAVAAKAQENWDLYLRAAAELENVRKRATRDVENARKFALERFARELLQVCDSLEMGISAGTDAGAEALLEGSNATLKQLTNTLGQFGVAVVDPLGEPFDPELHEAMTVQPSTDAEPGSVLTVFQNGYTLNGRLLRPARVVVAEAPSESRDS